MSIKKNFLDNYLQEREDKNLTTILEKPKYSHNRVFDEPSYLKEESSFIEELANHSIDLENHNKNLGQSYSKVTPYIRTKLQQSSDEVTTNLGQTEAYKTLTEDKVKAEHQTNPKANLGQLNNNSVSLTHYSSLIGLQRKIVVFIYNSCKIIRNSVTNPIAIEYLSEQCQTTKKSAQKTVQRLVQKGIIIRAAYKDGRGGWTQYELNERIFQEILHEESRSNFTTNLGQSYDKITPEYRSELMTSSPSSSSLLNKTTTITNEEKNELPEEWKEIDIELLTELIRFHRGHIGQLFKHGLDLKPVQESIYHYAFDLTENDKAKDIKTDPLSYFMGIMKRTGYYSAPENYESPQARGKRLFLEQEAIKAQKLLDAEKNLMNIHFDVWSNKLTQEEKIELVGKDELGPNRTVLTVNDKLRQHYKNILWKEQYQKICGER